MITPYTFDFRNRQIKEEGGTPIKESPLPYNFYQQEKELSEVENGPGEDPVPLPVITPDNNPFVDPVTIAITCTDPGASIYWTDDGSTPSAAKTLYSGPFSLSGASAWTVKAIAINGARTSAIATEVVTQSVVATPVLSQDGGTYYDSLALTITCATAGATIKYTTDGSTPSPTHGTEYTGAVTLDYATPGALFKAIAYKTGYTNSAVKSAVFSLSSYLMYWGASASETLDRAGIVALANKNNTAFTTSPVTYTFGANSPDKYLYLVMPAMAGLKPIADTGFVTGGLSMMGDLATVAPYTSYSNGWPLTLVTLAGPYQVYRTKNLIASALNIVVTRG